MSFFNTILEKLGIHKKEQAKPAASAPTTPTHIPTTFVPASKPPASSSSAKPAAPSSGAPASTPTTPAAPAQPAPTPISEVDVVKKLEKMSEGSGLDWKVSIVDLLKVLGIDSSREARNELAKELGCPPELMSDSAKMNTWLHKTVLRKIAENGGNIPQSLLD
jgi:hypothetical protein